MIALVAGFLGFHIVDKAVLIHSAHEGEYGKHSHGHPSVGVASALALAGHSLTDEIAIGLAFQVSQTVGFGVALAVIGHDFVVGLFTVSLLLTNRNSRQQVWKYLALDALTPWAGAALTLFIRVPDNGLLIYLGVFAGFLPYIGASDVLPEAHSKQPSAATLALTVAGAGAIHARCGRPTAIATPCSHGPSGPSVRAPCRRAAQSPRRYSSQ